MFTIGLKMAQSDNCCGCGGVVVGGGSVVDGGYVVDDGSVCGCAVDVDAVGRAIAVG